MTGSLFRSRQRKGYSNANINKNLTWVRQRRIRKKERRKSNRGKRQCGSCAGGKQCYKGRSLKQGRTFVIMGSTNDLRSSGHYPIGKSMTWPIGSLRSCCVCRRNRSLTSSQTRSQGRCVRSCCRFYSKKYAPSCWTRRPRGFARNMRL